MPENKHDKDDASYVVVSRRADQPVPWVPSLEVQCGMCGEDCWLSAKTGAGTLACARQDGSGEIRCSQCMSKMIAGGLEATLTATPEAKREAAMQARRDLLGTLRLLN